ncbi:MAG: MMPL family transporter, partial [Acidimicrobiales bacterium]|nr:MMPL family transporter [Acidimicrobiales bacterium]
ALGRVGESISFSAFTVIAALLSLLASTFGLYKSLGGPLAIGIFIMLLAGLTLLPALLAIFGRAVFWPSKNKEGMNKAGLWGKAAARIVKRPGITLGVGVTIFALLAVASFGNKPAGFGGSTTAPKGSNAAIGAALIDQHFPHSSSNPTTVVMKFRTSIWSDPSLAEKATSRLSSSNVFTTVEGPLNPLGINLSPSRYVSLHKILGNPRLLPPIKPSQLNISNVDYLNYRATSQFVSADGFTVLFETSLSAGDPSSTNALNAVPQIRDAVSSAASSVGAAASGVTGEAPALYDISTSSNRDLVHVIPLAVLVIGFLLMLVMRSLVAPIYLIASVALSYMAALGLSVIVFIYILGDGGLTFILPFLMFLFLLALGEDYNILVMTRIREEAHELPLREAVAKAISTTGTTVTSAGLVLAGTFAVFAIAGASTGTTEIRDVGFGLALGVLMDTFLVRTLLVPSTVVLLGKLNWWPSKLAQVEHGESIQQ